MCIVYTVNNPQAKCTDSRIPLPRAGGRMPLPRRWGVCRHSEEPPSLGSNAWAVHCSVPREAAAAVASLLWPERGLLVRLRSTWRCCLPGTERGRKSLRTRPAAEPRSPSSWRQGLGWLCTASLSAGMLPSAPLTDLCCSWSQLSVAAFSLPCPQTLPEESCTELQPTNQGALPWPRASCKRWDNSGPCKTSQQLSQWKTSLHACWGWGVLLQSLLAPGLLGLQRGCLLYQCQGVWL